MFRDKLKLSKERLSRSLNFHSRKKENRRIDGENERLARRIIEKLPTINFPELNREYRKNVRYKKLLLKLNMQAKTPLMKKHKSSFSIEASTGKTNQAKRKKHKSKSLINKLNELLSVKGKVHTIDDGNFRSIGSTAK
eukprot:TRINITY_DN8157_c0_g1_i21.p2 TRINITY_DN8157_c0_g1~~TRINITY_DN8157_c0_g1_i21.p2  ORF type:complete len:138 (-),score=24.92 TRINITY_DN8157_c0_g1_i21:147-560(-)